MELISRCNAMSWWIHIVCLYLLSILNCLISCWTKLLVGSFGLWPNCVIFLVLFMPSRYLICIFEALTNPSAWTRLRLFETFDACFISFVITLIVIWSQFVGFRAFYDIYAFLVGFLVFNQDRPQIFIFVQCIFKTFGSLDATGAHLIVGAYSWGQETSSLGYFGVVLLRRTSRTSCRAQQYTFIKILFRLLIIQIIVWDLRYRTCKAVSWSHLDHHI